MLDEPLHQGWREVLEPVLASDRLRALDAELAAAEASGTAIYPPRGQRLRVFDATAPRDVRAVIVGQDPYHGPGQAHGLAFSVPEGVKPPPSLRNIFAELAQDIGCEVPRSGDLSAWAGQGVLLLNTSLSVEDGRAGSHAGRGWEEVTGAALRTVAASDRPTAFILWGKHAQDRARDIPGLDGQGPHLVLRSVHPSPLSARRGFFGSRPFSKANAFLEAHGRGTIDWAAPG